MFQVFSSLITVMLLRPFIASLSLYKTSVKIIRWLTALYLADKL